MPEPSDLPHIAFTDTGELWGWLRSNHATHAGVWVVLQKTSSRTPSVTFHDLLEAGIAFGWSESTRTEASAKRSTWRYVATVSTDESVDEAIWEVRELYNTRDGGFGFTAEAIAACGGSLEELRRDLRHMLDDTRRPALDLTVDPPQLRSEASE